MAVFGLTHQIMQKASNVLVQADALAEKAFAVLDTIEAIVEGGPTVLGRLKNAVQAVINFNNNAINLLKNNPAIQGPWKILATVVAGILRGVGVMLNGLKNAITVLINVLKNQKVKNLKNKVGEIQGKLVEFTQVSNRAKELAGYLMALAAFLESQQSILEKAYPGLKEAVKNNQLKEINALLTELGQLLTEINATIDGIVARLDSIKALIDNANAIVNSVGRAFDAINSVMRFFNDILNKIKELISKIPFIGWLQDKIGELIEFAMDKLGIRALLDRLGGTLRDLPFVKDVFDFLDAIKAKIDEIIATVTEYFQKILKEIKNNEKFNEVVNFLVVLFAGLNVEKILREFFLPDWVNELIEKVQAAREKINAFRRNPESPAMKAKIVEEVKTIQAEVAQLTTLMQLAPDLPLEHDRQDMLHEAFGSLASTLAEEETMTPTNGPVFAMEEKQLVAMQGSLELIRKRYQEILSDAPKFDADYFLGGYYLLEQGVRQHEGLQGYRKVVDLLKTRVQKHAEAQ